jgi:ribosomal protein L16 Arg81 hydroxylase
MTNPTTVSGQFSEVNAWGLDELLHPLETAQFFERHWQREPLVITDRRPDHYGPLMTLNDLDFLLATSSAIGAQVQTIVDGRRLDLPLADPNAALESIFSRYRQGASIILSALHLRWPPLARLCRSLSRVFSANLRVNAYITPAGVQGFDTHFDTHDVLVAQMHGSKYWRLYQTGRPLPEIGEQLEIPPEGIGEPIKQSRLISGDLMYIPRGTPHDATTRDEMSVHLTIGIYPITWAGLIRHLVNDVIAHDLGFREALPAGFGHDPTLARQSSEQLQRLCCEVVRAINPARGIEAAVRTLLGTNVTDHQGQLVDLDSADAITPDTRMAGRPGVTWIIRERGAQVLLEFHGKTLRFPSTLLPQLSFIAQGNAFAARDLPGELSENARLTLLTELLTEGFLTRRQ